jgi:hypothetical protein
VLRRHIPYTLNASSCKKDELSVNKCCKTAFHCTELKVLNMYNSAPLPSPSPITTLLRPDMLQLLG